VGQGRVLTIPSPVDIPKTLHLWPFRQ